MSGRRTAAVALSLALTVGSVAAAADVIMLRNGDNIRGSITRETQSGIIVRVGRNQEIYIAYEEISEVRRDGEVGPRVPRGPTGPSGTRDRQREQALIRQYSRALERAYRKLHPEVERIPYAVKRVEFDPVRAAKRYGLPVSQAESNQALESMFELALRCYSHGSPRPWRRTLLFYNQSRRAYIEAVSKDVDLANIYLDFPDMPYLLNLQRG